MGWLAFAASVFLNDVFLGSTQGSDGVEQTNALYSFPTGAVKLGADNVITIVQVCLHPGLTVNDAK